MKNQQPTSLLANYVLAIRPWSFSISLMPVLLGTTLAYKSTGHVSAALAVLTVVAVALIHGAGNLVNTYYDFVNRIDRAENDETEDRTLVDGRLEPDQVSNFGTLLYCAGVIVFAFICALSPAQISHMALIFFGGLTGSFLYTGGVGFKYYAFGDVIVILTFGPLAVLFAYVTQTGVVSLAPIVFDIPLALFTEAILLAKYAKEADYHRRCDVRSLPIILGRSLSYVFYMLVLFVPYITFIFMGLNMSYFFFLPAVTLVSAFDLEKLFRADCLKKLHKKTWWLSLLVNCLYITSCYLANRLPFL
eukprot:m.5466 g.5466  ORF g.5466 m.5466 type:complete len:304 (+) comp13239_c0_seq1:106-1017(+)